VALEAGVVNQGVALVPREWLGVALVPREWLGVALVPKEWQGVALVPNDQSEPHLLEEVRLPRSPTRTALPNDQHQKRQKLVRQVAPLVAAQVQRAATRAGQGVDHQLQRGHRLLLSLLLRLRSSWGLSALYISTLLHLFTLYTVCSADFILLVTVSDCILLYHNFLYIINECL